ncbi:MAG: hypothetical protein M0011_03440 [Elusimicrobia bacterium]|nr:hypothetical protein [Elusimicrobiota bacterium]
MRSAALLLCLMAGAVPASAQVFLGAEVGPDSFLKNEPGRIDTSGEDAYSWALSAEVSSSTLYAVFESTTPEREMLSYLRGGIYRQELAFILLLSERSKVPFKKLAAELPKAGGLRGLAKAHGADAMALFGEAGRLKADADARAPLFLPPPTSTSTAVNVSSSPPAGTEDEN